MADSQTGSEITLTGKSQRRDSNAIPTLSTNPDFVLSLRTLADVVDYKIQDGGHQAGSEITFER